jgi:hypothetical protein
MSMEGKLFCGLMDMGGLIGETMNGLVEVGLVVASPM